MKSTSMEFRMKNHTYPSFSLDASTLAMANGRNMRDCKINYAYISYRVAKIIAINHSNETR